MLDLVFTMRELILEKPEMCPYRSKGKSVWFCNKRAETAYCDNFTDDDGFPPTCPLKKV